MTFEKSTTAQRGAFFLNGPDTEAKKTEPMLYRFMQDRHMRAARALSYALTLANPRKWAATSIIWEARLDHVERYELARSVLLAMRPEVTEVLFEDVMGGAGYPLPTFIDPLDDARWWADMANEAELEAFCFATFMALPRSVKLDFIEFAKAEVA